MGVHPEHRIDMAFLEHTVPIALIDLFLAQLEIVTQQIIGISGGCPAVHKYGYRAPGPKDQNSTIVPVIEQSRMRIMQLKIKRILLRNHWRKSKRRIYV